MMRKTLGTIGLLALGVATGWAQSGVPSLPGTPPPPGHDTHFGNYNHPHNGYSWVWTGSEYELRYGPYGHAHYGEYWENHAAPSPVLPPGVPAAPVAPAPVPAVITPSYPVYRQVHIVQQPCYRRRSSDTELLVGLIAFGALAAAISD
jgi:hypothetical protein